MRRNKASKEAFLAKKASGADPGFPPSLPCREQRKDEGGGGTPNQQMLTVDKEQSIYKCEERDQFFKTDP